MRREIATEIASGQPPKVISIRLDAALGAELVKRAAEAGTNLAEMARRLLRDQAAVPSREVDPAFIARKGQAFCIVGPLEALEAEEDNDDCGHWTIYPRVGADVREDAAIFVTLTKWNTGSFAVIATEHCRDRGCAELAGEREEANDWLAIVNPAPRSRR